MSVARKLEGGRSIMDAAAISNAIERMAGEIAKAGRAENPAFIGIRTRGVPLATRLAARLHAATGTKPEMGTLDITLYRDDLSESPDWPVVGESDIPFEIAGRTVILVDDVLFTGRTIRAALNAIMDYGRPRRVMLAVLVDRGLRELPLAADVAGITVETSSAQYVAVRFAETDGKDEVLLA